MDIGLVKDRRPFEHRVGLTPGGVRVLTEKGHRVYVEDGAGVEAGFDNRAFERVGATVVYSEDDVLLRSELVIRVSPPQPADYHRFQEGQRIGFLAPGPGAGNLHEDFHLLDLLVHALHGLAHLVGSHTFGAHQLAQLRLGHGVFEGSAVHTGHDVGQRHQGGQGLIAAGGHGHVVVIARRVGEGLGQFPELQQGLAHLSMGQPHLFALQS